MKKIVLLLANIVAINFCSLAQITIALQPNAAQGKDAEIFSCVPCGYANNNYGTKQDFDAIAWTNNENLSKVRSLIQFDLSSIPSNSIINSATLSLYFNNTSTEGHHITSFFSPNSSYLQRITSTWGETTVTWNNQPTTTTTHQVSLAHTTSTTQSFTSINVATLVQDMVSNPSTSFGFMLRLQNESAFKKLIFASSDHPNAALHPKLVITYTTPPAPIPVVSSNGNTEKILTHAFDFSISPNPATEKISLLVNAETKTSFMISVFDMTGKLVLTQHEEANEGMSQIQVSAATLPKGVYVVNAKSDNAKVAKKLVIE
jgi:hypothetical protein